MISYGDIGTQLQGAGGTGDLLSLLKGLGFSANPVNPFLSAGLDFGKNLLGGLGGLLFGGQERARTNEIYNLAKNRLGQNVINPDQYLAQYQQTLAPRFNMQAEGINRRLGLDSGVAQAELGSQMQAPLAQFLLQAKQQNDILKNQNDNGLLQLMASLRRG